MKCCHNSFSPLVGSAPAGDSFFSSNRPPYLQWIVTGGVFPMTNEQKEQVKRLRGSGYGYATIADALGLTKNQVSAFCRRNNLTGTIANGNTPAPDVGCCLCCGKPLVQTPGKKASKFCSDACRNKWWNAHLDQVNRKALYQFTCACCGKPFSAYGNSKRKYCSHECYIKARFKGGGSIE